MHHVRYATVLRLTCSAVCALTVLAFATPATQAEPGKGHRILIEQGLQIQGMITRDDVFNINTYTAANYTSTNWIWHSRPTHFGDLPWGRWVHETTPVPAPDEAAHLDRLISLQLGDEQDLNNPTKRDQVVAWVQAVKPLYPNALVFVNNFGGQVNDAALHDFITRAQPDMLCFDTYPWRSQYLPPQPGQSTGTPGQPLGGPPTGWYGDLRRYRVHALQNNLPLATYRQTFHALQDYDATVYRDPSAAELRLNTFGALAFGVTKLIDFTYNTGASSLFTTPGGDSNPTPLYAELQQANRQARNLGKALVHLTALDNHVDGSQPTMDILFHRGRTGPNNTDVTPLPVGFVPDDSLPNTMSEWIYRRNDPHIAGFAVTNLGTLNNSLRGDAIFSWFKPLDPSLDDPAVADDQLYLMVVNAFTGPDGAASDYRQRIAITMESTAGTHLQYLDPNDGEVKLWALEAIPNSQRRRLVVELDGGSAMLFKFNSNTPFIHLVPEPASLGFLGLGALALRRASRMSR
jgi:hypothetical protein